MDLKNLDLRLKVDTDSYLLDFPSFKFIKDMFDAYNELQSTKDKCIINLRDTRFYDRYQKIYNLLSVVDLKRDFDDDELMFISNIIYKQKGSPKAICTLFSLINCDYLDENIYIDEDLTLHINVSFNNVKEIFLTQKFLKALCQELLYYKKYEVSIDSLSTKFVLTGDVNKRYAIYTTYDLLTKSYSEDTSEEIVPTIDNVVEGTKRTIDNTKGTETTTETTISKVNDEYKIITNKRVNTYKKLDTYSIDTYEW